MHRHIVFYKPYGVLTQFSESGESLRPTLKNFIPVPGVYAVGRLDQDSEGLVFLTSDGLLQHQLSDPKFDHPKTYWVQVEGEPDAGALLHLARGVMVQGYRTRPAEVSRLTDGSGIAPRDPPVRFRKNIPTAWIEITITEGRNRQVRRMTAAVGFPTLRLIRVAIATLRLDSLAPGQWRDLTAAELGALRKRI